MSMPKGLTKKARDKYIANALDLVLAGLGEVKSQLQTFAETIMTELNKNELDIVSALNDSTNQVGGVVQKAADAMGKATQAITDLFANKSSITLADIQPHLTAMSAAATSLGTAADALNTLATQDDPAINPAAAPITVTPPATPTDPTPTPVVVSDVPPAPDGTQPIQP